MNFRIFSTSECISYHDHELYFGEESGLSLMCQYFQMLPLITTCLLRSEVLEEVYCLL